MKKIVSVLGGAILFLGLKGCVGVDPGGQGYNIAVPMGIINTTVGQNFPQTKQTNYGTLMMDKPNILGKQGSNKLGVGTTFSFSNVLIPNGIKGAISFSSGVRYNASDRGLYLANPMIDEIKLHDFALSTYMTPEIRNLIGEVVTQQLLTQPIYHMNTMGTSLVKGIGINNGNVVVTVGL